jgi:hypothetical protein
MSIKTKNKLTDSDKAIAWWGMLRDTRLCNGTKDKGYYVDKYFGFNMRMFKYINNKEIEAIWNAEFGCKEKPNITV